MRLAAAPTPRRAALWIDGGGIASGVDDAPHRPPGLRTGHGYDHFMTTPTVSRLPASALEWMISGSNREVLSIGAPSSDIARALAATTHRLTVIDRSSDALNAVGLLAPTARRIVAQPESLPFAPCFFDTVLSAQNLHTVAPGLAYGEFARVLKPSGSVAVMYLTRDDSVPWVRRLAQILQGADPSAMRGGYGTDSVDSLADSEFFPDLEHRGFRMWIPVTRPALQAMVRERQSLKSLSTDELDRLSAAVAELYDASARAPEPLLLPWRVQCWRAQVDQSELSRSLLPSDDAVNIRL